MDAQIYRLLARADQEKNAELVKEAFFILDPEIASAKEKTAKDIENFSQNLYVECAEKAIGFNEIAIANRCIQLYFSLPMIANQFLARAYLCQFELLAPRSTNQLEYLEKSIPFLFKAIDFAVQNKRYNFLVYNSSIIFWKYARAFLKVNFKRFLCTSLNKIMQALRDIDDADYEWRCFLEKTLIEAYLDNKQNDEANTLASELCKFIQSYLPNYLDEFFEFLMANNLLDEDELKALAATKWDLNVIYKIEKLKKVKKPKKILADISSEEAIQNELNEIYKLLLPKKNPVINEDKSEFMTSSFDSTSKKEDFVTAYKKQKLVLSLTHLCLFFEEVSLCSQILGYLKETEHFTEEFSIELEFVECDQAIKELKHKQERFTKNIVKVRTDSINKCHEALKNALRTYNNRLIQLGCIMQWNFCLPLLQPGVRSNVRKPLTFVAECLETIESMEWLLRCQIHFELAKCDEEIEQLQTAEQHLLKAIQLDDENIYKEQLDHSLKRLRLRAELYKTPERTEDQVAMIIEQCVVGGKSNIEKKLKPAIHELLESLNTKKNGTEGSSSRGEINTRSLIVRAADLLAPSEFTHVLESETFKANFGKLNEDLVTRLHKKTLNYENCVRKGSDHLNHRIHDYVRNQKRSNPQIADAEIEDILRVDFKERLKLWFDLSRIARKQQIWDVCRVSSRFCLLYDNDQYVNRFLKNPQTQPPKFSSLFDIELMRNLAEAHFILGESLVQYIRGEGIELFDKPKIPDMTEQNQLVSGKKVKIADENSEEQGLGIQNPGRDFENDKEWKEYCDWLNKLCKEAVNHFLKGIQIGVELNESWLVCQGSAYTWNYLHHILEKKKYPQILPILNEVLDALRKVGHDTESELLVAVCVAISTGLMVNWLPQDQVKILQMPSDPALLLDKQGRKTAIQVKPLSLPPEGVNDFKKALEICEYGMNVTNGDDMKDVVSLRHRFPLIKCWVLAKQICQSPIKNFGLTKNNSGIERIQDRFTKCMVGVEILNRNLKMAGQNSYEIKEAPSIRDVINLIDQAINWPDKLIELELWANLAILAGRFGQTDNLRYCYTKSLESLSYFEKKKNENKSIYMKSQFLLSLASIALGEHLAYLLSAPSTAPTGSKKEKQQLDAADQVQSSSASITSNANKDIRVALRRNALNAFADATSYAANAENYDNVVHAARHYWNLCLPYLAQAQERATLYENLSEILASWNAVYKFKPPEDPMPPMDSETNKQEEKKEPDSKANKGNKTADKSKKRGSSAKSPSRADAETDPVKLAMAERLANEDAFDDLTLRCVLYACLFQISIDKNQFEEALDQMELALADLPRTKHRLLIYRFKVITKSKLGLDVQMDLQKFREESEKNLALMYRKVALSSIKHSDTIQSYQRAIETLSSEESIWLKFEYIIELAQYMYSHEYSLDACVELCEWAADLITFKLKLEKASRAVSAVTNNTSARNSGKSKSKLTNRQSISVMPTIQDDVEIKSIHRKIEQHAQEEFENLINSATKESLFEVASADSTKNFSWVDIQDIKQLECLIRVNTIIALMTGPTSQNYSNYLIKAYYSLSRLFTQAVDNAVNAQKEIQKLGTQTEVTGDKKKADGKKSATTTEKPSQKKGKSDVGQASLIPQTLEQWSQFELSEEIYTAWSHEHMKKTGINKHSITEPYLLFYYLDNLAKMLNKQGYTQLLFPVYNLQLILIQSAISFDSHAQNTSLYIYTRMNLINLCVELNLIQSIGFHQQALASFILNAKQATPEMAATIAAAGSNPNPTILLKLIQIDPIEVCLSREQINTHKQRLAQLEDEESALATQSTNSFSSFKKGHSSNSIVQSKMKFKKKQQTQSKSQNVKISDSSKASKNQMSQIVVEHDFRIPGEQRKINSNLFDTLYKDVWILMAEFLIQNGYFQLARDYLYESLNACLTFEDQNTHAKAQYLLGQIALFDSNFIEARNYASSAQRIAIDELFWFKSIRLLVESHRYDYTDKDAYEKCINIVNKALDLVRQERENRVNKSNNLAYIEAMLINDLADITYDGTLNGKLSDQDMIRRHRSGKRGSKRNSMHPSLFRKLSQVSSLYQQSIELLLRNGFRREAVYVMKSSAKLLKLFGKDSQNAEAKKDYFLQTFSVLNDALDLLNEIVMDSISLQSSHELQNVSLPIQREMMDLKLEISQLLTDILQYHLEEVKEINDKNIKKDHLLKTVENFIENKENLSEMDEEWNAIIAQIPDLLSGYLISCHNLSIKLKNFKAFTLYLIGRAYRLTSELKYQLRKINLNDNLNSNASILNLCLPITKWSPNILEIISKNQQQALNEGETTGKSKKSKPPGQTADDSMNSTAREEVSNDGQANTSSDNNTSLVEESNMTNIADQESLKNLLISVNNLEAQGMECLLQAQNLAFSLEDKNLSRNIAYELIEFVGRFDLNLCSQLIAFYQSYSIAIEVEKLVEKSSLNPKNSLLTGYLNQMKFYKKQNVTQNTLNSPITKQILEMTKSKFNATKYLNINLNHFNFSRDLPPNYVVLVLQHNEAKTELYGTILDRIKSPANASKNSKVPVVSNSNLTKAAVIKVKTDAFELHHLQQQWRDWKASLQSFNLKLEFQLNNDLIKKHQASTTTAGVNQTDHSNDFLKHYLDPNGTKYDEMLQLLNDLEGKFEFLINSTEIYLKEITEFVQNYFVTYPNDLVQMGGKSGSMSTPGKPIEKLIILADLELLEIPLESLKIFHDNINLCSISRDFSLQFFATRFYAPKENPESGKGDDKKGDKGAKPNPKQTQAPPVALEPLPDYALTVDLTRVKYLIDPFNETSSGIPTDYSPIGAYKKLSQQFGGVVSKWSGLSGTDHSPSLGECENLLLDSSCFLFTGTERFLSYFSANRIASLNLDCRLIFANDMAQTNKSFSRLGKDDVLKNPSELDCENPLEASILLSLTGTRCIMTNQWTTNIVDNSDKFYNIMKEFLENRQSCGEILRYRMSPHLRFILNENAKKEEEKKQAAANEKDKKDAKKPDAKTKDAKPKSPKKLENESQSGISPFHVDEQSKAEEEAKRLELLKNLSRVNKENLNMVCYGLPDVYMPI